MYTYIYTLHTNKYIYIYIHMYIYIYICIGLHGCLPCGSRREPDAPLPVHRQDLWQSGVHKGGCSKGGFSNLCLIIMLVLRKPPLLDPPL